MRRFTWALLLSLTAPAFAAAAGYETPRSVDYGFAAPEGYQTVELHPVGWSRNGLFAYALWRDDYGRGGDFSVIVRDLKTDSVVWSFDYYEEGPTSFAGVWDYTYARFAGKLYSLGIVQETDSAQSLPYVFGTDSISIEVQAQRDGLTNGGYIRSFEVAAVSQIRGAKSLCFEPRTFLESVDPVCCLRSPYEKRIAVVVLQTIPAMDGLPGMVAPLVTGCHLGVRYVR